MEFNMAARRRSLYFWRGPAGDGRQDKTIERMKNFIRAFALFVAVNFCFCGCGKKPDSTASNNTAANDPLPEPPLVAACAPGKPGGRLVIATFGDPKTFNPITANESSSEEIYRHLFASLLGFDTPSQSVSPGLAAAWTNSPDGKTWTFTLRKNLRWSDGAPLTADDVVFTWDVIYNPEIDNVMRDAFLVDGKKFIVTKVDDLTVQVVTPEIYAPFLETFGAGVPVLPKHILAKTVADKTFTSAYGVNWDAEKIVGSGPFRLKEYRPAQSVLLERNPYFFEVDSNGQRLPYFDDIIYTIVPDMNAMSLRFLSGESDADDFVLPYEYDHFKTEAAQGKFNLLEPGIGLETAFFWFNENTNVDAKTGRPLVAPEKSKWFRNTKFRQAMAYAIDRDSIIKSIYNGRAIPNYGLVTPGNKKWFNPNTPQYPQDLDKAALRGLIVVAHLVHEVPAVGLGVLDVDPSADEAIERPVSRNPHRSIHHRQDSAAPIRRVRFPTPQQTVVPAPGIGPVLSHRTDAGKFGDLFADGGIVKKKTLHGFYGLDRVHPGPEVHRALVLQVGSSFDRANQGSPRRPRYER